LKIAAFAHPFLLHLIYHIAAKKAFDKLPQNEDQILTIFISIHGRESRVAPFQAGPQRFKLRSVSCRTLFSAGRGELAEKERDFRACLPKIEFGRPSAADGRPAERSLEKG
jgi:hypothetical protein